MSYKSQLSEMVKMVDVLTRLRIYQARKWDAPWFEGKYYGAIRRDCVLVISGRKHE